MSYKAILFDMDGTLVPMDMMKFTNGYFKDLGKKLEKFGFEQSELEAAIWAGTKQMVLNDGSQKNKERFWAEFAKIMNETVEEAEEVDAMCNDFYGNEFKTANRFTMENPLAKIAVEISRKKAEKVVLATNPIFPMVAQKTRLSWVGLNMEDFDLVTSFETDCFCKPNPQYYLSVCERIGVDPKDCLMVGNDEKEDMYAATKAGLDCYLVTDTMIPSKDHPWDGKKGTFTELVAFLSEL